MKSERNILIAFILNLAFSVFEFFGGAITGSVAIISDAVHDVGDAISIGLCYLFERKSKRKPDEFYTYGYTRYSVAGSVITTVILLVGSVVVIYSAIRRIISPVEINYNGMILFAVVGVCVNLVAAWVTSRGESLNQKAVNLHMLEDVLGWVVVLIGAIVMRFTDIRIIDPIMSVCVAAFIFVNAVKHLIRVVQLFLEKIPDGICVHDLKDHICSIDGVKDAHHIHVWSLDGISNYATMHIVTDGDTRLIKKQIREALKTQGIVHVTLELEEPGETCCDEYCKMEFAEEQHDHHASGLHKHSFHHHHHH